MLARELLPALDGALARALEAVDARRADEGGRDEAGDGAGVAGSCGEGGQEVPECCEPSRESCVSALASSMPRMPDLCTPF